MNKKAMKMWVITGAMFILFILYTILVKTVDVAAVGPMDTSVGFSTLNVKFHSAFETNEFWYDVSKYLGYVGLLSAGILACMSLLQLFKRKNIFKVDGCLLSADVVTVLLGVFYVVFEIVIINYRCVIMPGDLEPEASYPSSHTMLLITMFGLWIFVVGNYIKNRAIKIAVQIALGIGIFLGVLGRIISGVHWITDIIGGIIISVTLLIAYFAVLNTLKKK